MTLSTNTLYYSAFSSAALMASALARPAAEVAAQNAAADALRSTINQYFWIPAKGTYGYLIHNGDGGPAGTLDPSEEGTGLSFAILFGIASTAFIVNAITNDGETTWFEGLLLIGVYAVFGMAFFFA